MGRLLFRRVSVALSCLALTATVTAAPAQAQTTTCDQGAQCPTSTTFTVLAGELEITVPDAAAVGSGSPGAQFSGQLGATTVSDDRGALTATWTASVIGTAFTTGTGTAPETIPSSAVSYWSGPATATSGTGTFVPGQATAGAAQTLDVSRTAFGKTTGTGNNSASWNPTIVVDVPAAAVAGSYAGTVNQSVA